MESRPLRRLFFNVLTTLLLALSLGEETAPRMSFERFSQNIVGGRKAARGRYPYMCSIHYDGGHECSGFLVHPKIIITAAHCYKYAANFSYYCGGYTWHESDKTAQKYTGKFALRYNPGGGDCHLNDVAVILLNEESNITLPIVSRDLNQINHGRSAVEAGWGDTWFPFGGLTDELKIIRGLRRTPFVCANELRTICTYSLTGRASYGDSGGPLLIEGKSAEEDVVFGITNGYANFFLNTVCFSNLPHFLEYFISVRARDAENSIEAKLLAPPYLPPNPTEVSSDSIQIEIGNSSITFACSASTSGDQASVAWNKVKRVGAEVRLDINIDGFAAKTRGDFDFKLEVYEHVTLYIQRSSKSAEWLSGNRRIATSLILPGSGLHKARVKHTHTGVEIYEDGMKSAVFELPSPCETVVPQFSTIAENAGLSYTISITNVRINPVPVETQSSESVVVY